MKYLGVAGVELHDAGMTLIDDKGGIEFASLSERYTGEKHDGRIPPEMWEMSGWYDHNDIQLVMNDDWKLREYFRKGCLDQQRLSNPRSFDASETLMHQKHASTFIEHNGAIATEHHSAHAAAALMTRPKDWSRSDCVCVVIDGIGEFRSAGVYNSELELVWEMTFPKSIGYLYATFTDLCGLGLRSNNDEYVVMGLSSYGEPTHWKGLYEIFQDIEQWDLKDVGVRTVSMPKGANVYDYKLHHLKTMVKYLQDNCKSVEDQAASLQRMTTEVILDVMRVARKFGSKLCYSGGVAQNIVSNGEVSELFDDMWVDVNPGDGGASLGAAGFQLFKDTGIDRLDWEHPFHGFDIEGDLDPERVVAHLLRHKVCGVANGRAEFSYRAYGNRSLIADVRYDVKDTVNEIKQRQKFRPFAPAILEEHASDYFSGAMNQWMQYCAKSNHPYSSVTHVDGTGRVQLVPKDCKSVFRQIIECYYAQTGVPMLLNTSLNIRGKPMVNDRRDAWEFEQMYGVKVFTS
jgi:carbamoyltransferase